MYHNSLTSMLTKVILMAYYPTFPHALHTTIMYTSKSFFVIAATIVTMSFNVASAQTAATTDSIVKRKPSLVITVGGGFAQYLSHVYAPASLEGSVTKTSPVATFRAMWHPGYLLNLGIETGYTNFYSYDVNNNNVPGKARLS